MVTFGWLDWELRPRALVVRECRDPRLVVTMLEDLLDTEVRVVVA